MIDVIDAYCGARTRSGGRCRKPAGSGTDHRGYGRCKNHAGCTPDHQLSGVVHLARREQAVMGRPLDIDPASALLELIRIAAGEVQYASDRIADLELKDALVAEEAVKERPLDMGSEGESRRHRVREVTTTNQVQLHAWIRVRHDAMDRLHTYSKTALANNIAERYVRLAEDQGRKLAVAIRGILTDVAMLFGIELLGNQEVMAVVRRHLAGASAVGPARQLAA